MNKISPFPRRVDVSDWLDHDDPLVTVVDYPISREWTKYYSMLETQFDGAVKFYNWVIETECAEMVRLASEEKQYSAPSFYEISDRIKEFKSDKHFWLHADLCAAMLRPAAMLAYHNLSRARHWVDPLRYLRYDYLDEIELTNFRGEIKVGERKGTYRESGTIIFDSPTLTKYCEKNNHPEWIIPVYLSVIGVVCLDASGAPQVTDQMKRFFLLKCDGELCIRIVYGPVGRKVCAFPKKQTDQPAENHTVDSTELVMVNC